MMIKNATGKTFGTQGARRPLAWKRLIKNFANVYYAFIVYNI
jgi:hypothetical protein